MRRIKLQLESNGEVGCMKNIRKLLSNQSGVAFVQVLCNSGKIKVEYDATKITADHFNKIIERMGYTILEPEILAV